SLGEISALHWAGALSEDELFAIAAARGRIMAELDGGDGAMASIVAPADVVEPLLSGGPVVIAGYNSPKQTLVSGPAAAVDQVCATAVAGGLNAMRIAVSHAFHSDLVAPAAGQLREVLAGVRFRPVSGRVLSTVTGTELPADTDLIGLLSRQVRDAVRFSEALGGLADEVDLLLEVGPGKVLRALATDIAPQVPTISMETDSPSLGGLFRAVAAAYVLGAPVNHAALSEGRFTRELPLDKEFRFFASPCEQAPSDELGNRPTARRQPLGSTSVAVPAGPVAAPVATPVGQSAADPANSALDVLRRLAAERAELPLEAVSANSNPLDELHLSSITVGQIVNQASRELGLAAPVATSSYATSTLAQLAQMLEQLGESAVPGELISTTAPGVAPWVRPFAVEWRPSPAAAAPAVASTPASWQLFATERHPLATELHKALQRAELGGGGVLLCLPTDCDEQHAGLMLQAARAALALPEPVRFVVVGDRRGGAGLAKTLCLEAPHVATTVISLPLPVDLSHDLLADAVTRIVADVAATQGFLEVRYQADGSRTVPVLTPMQLVPAAERQPVLGAGDVLVVTG
ncbi:MAG TPA: acyltransferase domain-containing protein, partial [Jatrophihabitans sp.]|nr:acyltransferase domain-containing protein [Jatrophihabitans sp.]